VPRPKSYFLKYCAIVAQRDLVFGAIQVIENSARYASVCEATKILNRTMRDDATAGEYLFIFSYVSGVPAGKAMVSLER
jgi:hypothetical protein